MNVKGRQQRDFGGHMPGNREEWEVQLGQELCGVAELASERIPHLGETWPLESNEDSV
jgi:hypothetical protein